MFPRIRELREDSDLTQSEIAKHLHCSQAAYSSYELGKRRIPIELLIALARYHNVSTDYLLGLTDDPPTQLTNIRGKQIARRKKPFSQGSFHAWRII